MGEKVLKTIVKLRRDNLFNYTDTFIPMKGEACLVDTPSSGLRVKYGDGTTSFSELNYADDVLLTGYYIEGNFYFDQQKALQLEKNTNRIYVDLSNAKLYIYNGNSFENVGGTISTATAENPGVVKLYETTGTNIDGTMTQKAITNELNKKFEVTVDGELISFI